MSLKQIEFNGKYYVKFYTISYIFDLERYIACYLELTL